MVLISGAFDNLRSKHVRLLHEASRLGPLHVLLWSDEKFRRITGAGPKFPCEERSYLLEAIRCVQKVHRTEAESTLDDPWAPAGVGPGYWVFWPGEANESDRKICASLGLEAVDIPETALAGFPDWGPAAEGSGRKKVIVTGCYDWLHSGHVRFFEEASALGDLYAVVGHDENIRLLKGEGHPLFSQEERRYMVGSVRHVTRALISSGSGWMDAEPEIARYRPDIYVVNEDGDRPEKRGFCARHGLEYIVLKRVPRPGLQPRQSTHLRGF